VTPSANLDLVRSIYSDWERGDFSSTEWADPEIEFGFADGPEPGGWTGLAGMAEGWRVFESTWEDFRPQPTEYRALDDERVLVVVQFGGRAKTSGMELGQISARNASLLQLRGGKVVRLTLYWDRDRAFADLGLSPEGDPSD